MDDQLKGHDGVICCQRPHELDEIQRSLHTHARVYFISQWQVDLPKDSVTNLFDDRERLSQVAVIGVEHEDHNARDQRVCKGDGCLAVERF